MIIKGIKYSRFPGMSRSWRIVGKDEEGDESYAEFGNLNLLIGKNAAGKSRTLDAIQEMAALISGQHLVEQTKYHTQLFDFIFTDKDNTYRYVLHFKEKVILEESLYINDEKVLDRAQKTIIHGGKTHDLSAKLKETELLINRKQDDKVFYFPEIVFWGFSLRTFFFSGQVEKDKYVEDLNSLALRDITSNMEDIGLIIPMFHWGRQDYGQKFEQEILDSMNILGYNLTDIDIKKSRKGYCINVEEDGKYMVPQQEMSQGMFRALALFVLLANAMWRNLSVCILVDDIGEGLDHERSKGFVDMIIRKTYDTQIQYFMSSNDRYIMNHIHLKYWTVVERQNDKSIFYNRFNSQKNFEDFRYTGLNNFDFYTTEFYRDGFGDDSDEYAEEGE